MPLPNNRVQYRAITSLIEPTLGGNVRAIELTEELAKSHAFYKTLFGRNGYDNKDGDIVAVIDDFSAVECSAYSKPWGDKTIISFSPLQQITVDGVAHEYAHSLEQAIIGMDYCGESGAIMEGYSDIFGELVEDWNRGGLNGDCDWNNFERDMVNPLSNGFPSQYHGEYWGNTKQLNMDHGWVHNNSTVISHCAYLMTQNGRVGEALSMEELANLWYNTLFLLPKNCTFHKLRERMETVAWTLKLSESKQERVREAFDEIGVEKEYEKVNSSFTLFVFGDAYSLCSGYSVAIQKYEKTGAFFWKEESFVDYQQLTVNEEFVALDLPKGEYRLVITNIAEPTQVAEKFIEVRTSHAVKSLIVYTNFTGHTHSFGDWEVVKQPTETETGLKERSCPCGETETETVPKLDSGIVTSDLRFELCEDKQSYAVVGLGGVEKNVVIPSTYENLPVVEIGNYALANSWYMESVTIPNSVRVINETAFCGSEKLSNITVAMDNPYFQSIDGNLYNNNGKTLLFYAVGKTETSFAVPDGVTKIEILAFYFSNLSEIVLPDSLTTICSSAFVACKNLLEIVIPNTVATIDGYAFEGCDDLTVCCEAEEKPQAWDENWDKTSRQFDNTCTVIWGYGAVAEESGSKGLYYWLQDDGTYVVDGIGECQDEHVVIPSTYKGKLVTALGEDAYWGDVMKSVEIPETVVHLGPWPFSAAGALERIIVSEDNPVYADIDGNLYNKEKTELLRYPMAKTATTFTLPSGVTAIHSYAVTDSKNLTSIHIGGSVASIGGYAFAYCENVESVTFGNSVVEIGGYAFTYCQKLTSVNFGSKLESIGGYAFYECRLLTEISLPDSLKNVGSGVFNATKCYLTASNWEDGVLYIGKHLIASQSGAMPSNYTIKDGTLCIAASAFAHKNYRLQSVKLADSVKWIGTGAFAYCYGLTTITLSNAVKGIGAKAFYKCESLTKIKIGSGVEYIGEDAFASCEKLQIHCVASGPMSGWNDKWNSSSRPVTWNYLGS